MIKITVSHTLLDASPELQTEANLALAKGATNVADGDNVIYSIYPAKLPLSKAITLASAGCSIEHMPLFIEVADKEANVPVGFPKSTYTDESDVVTPHTWETWMLPNYDILERDGRMFIGTNAGTGYDLSLAELSEVIGDLVAPTDLPPEEEI